MANPNTDFELDSLTFDSFERSAERDIVCLAPIRTVIRREEEILLIKRVRKVEEVDASPACPINTNQVSPGQREEEIITYGDAKID